MKKIEGRYNEASIFIDYFDEATEKQIITLLNQEFTKDLKIKIMPDCHAGAGCVIGTTMTINQKIVPNLVGVDIGCGMLTVELGKVNLELVAIDKYIQENIPSGMHVHDSIQDVETDISKLKCWEELDKHPYYYQSMGSLGGGNHFIEIDQDEEKNKYLIIHSGSRNLGLKVAEYYQNKAIHYHQQLLNQKREEALNIIEEYKLQGRQQDIPEKIKEINNLYSKLPIPKDLCYLEGDLFYDYLHDMNIAQQYASENRYQIANLILKKMKLKLSKLKSFETIHNYINMNDMILRKGAISAYDGELVLIPLNMRDGCIIGIGKGNEEYNYSAPHGAGRVLSRSSANNTISLSEFKASMKGIYSTTIL